VIGRTVSRQARRPAGSRCPVFGKDGDLNSCWMNPH